MMETEPNSGVAPAPHGSRPLVTWGVGVLCGLVLAAAGCVGLIAAASGVSFFEVIRSSMGNGRTVLISQPVVVRQILQLQRLETVMYTLENVVEGQRDSGMWPKFLAGDRILLIGHGEIVAGVDLSQIASNDVKVSGRSVTLRLPKAQLFSARIDNQKTRVYSRDTGILVPVDPNLETEVRREAERQLREAALRDGILQAAEQNARTTLTNFLRGLGFEQVEIR